MKRFIILSIALLIGLLSACERDMNHQPFPDDPMVISTPYLEPESTPTQEPDTSAPIPKFIKPTKAYYDADELIGVEIDYSTHLLSQTRRLYFVWDIFRARPMRFDEDTGQYVTLDSSPDRYPFTTTDDPYGGAVVFKLEPDMYEEGFIYTVRCLAYSTLDGMDLIDEQGDSSLYLIAENGGYRVSERDYTEEEISWLRMSGEEREIWEAYNNEWHSRDGDTQNLGDIDGDGKDDILITHRTEYQGGHTLLFGDGGELYMDYSYPPKIGGVDLDGDGSNEIVISYDLGGTSLLSSSEFAILRKQGEQYTQLPLPYQDNGYGPGFPYMIEWKKDYSVAISMEETGFTAQALVDKETQSDLYRGIIGDTETISATTYTGMIYDFDIVECEGKPAIKVYQAIGAPYGKEGLGACTTVFRYEGRTPVALESGFARWEI